jgi:hypothetical protein
MAIKRFLVPVTAQSMYVIFKSARILSYINHSVYLLSL